MTRTRECEGNECLGNSLEWEICIIDCGEYAIINTGIRECERKERLDHMIELKYVS